MKNIIFRKSNIILLLTMFFMIVLSILDSEFIINHIFFMIFVVVIFFFKNNNVRRITYYLLILSSIMGAALRIDLPENKIISQINVYYLFIVLYIVIFLYEIFMKQKFRQELIELVRKIKKFPNYLSIIFVIYVFCSFFWANNKILAIKDLFVYFMSISLVLIFIIENRDKDSRKDTLKLLLYISIGVLIYGTLKICLGSHIEPRSIYTDYESLRSAKDQIYFRVPTVFFYNPNDYAFVVCIIVLFVESLLDKIDVRKNNTLLYLFIFILGIINLVATMSRTAWISFFFGISIMTIIHVLLKEKQKAIINGVSIILSIFIFLIMSKNMYTKDYFDKLAKANDIQKSDLMAMLGDDNADRGFNYKFSSMKESNSFVILNSDAINMRFTYDKGDKFIFGTIGGENSLDRRSTLIYDTIKCVFVDKNYFGVGAGNISEYILNQNNTWGLGKPHNLWIEILGDFGIVGLLMFIIIYISILIKTLINYVKVRGNENIIVISILSSVTLLVLGPSSVVGNPIFWMVISYGILVSNLSKKEINDM